MEGRLLLCLFLEVLIHWNEKVPAAVLSLTAGEGGVLPGREEEPGLELYPLHSYTQRSAFILQPPRKCQQLRVILA